MGRVVQRNQPCPDTKTCNSSDACQVYDDGLAHCFSCSKTFKAGIVELVEQEQKRNMNTETLFDIESYDTRGFKERKITKTVCEFFGVKVAYDEDRQISAHYYPYGTSEVVGYKIRKLPKDFHVVGKLKGLFGQLKFNSGKRLVITEGELDALSVAQAYHDKYQTFYPVVSLPSANSEKIVLEQRDWIRQFDEVILMLDNDPVGQKAVHSMAKIIGADKVKIASLPEKDASDVLVKHSSEVIIKAIWDAIPWRPAGIIGKEELWKALEEYNDIESTAYPECLNGLNGKIKGMRLGEIALFTSGTGSGKSTILREIMLHLLRSSDARIGVISLEESPAETARKLAGMALNRNPTNEEIPLEELKVGFDEVFGSDRIMLLDHQGSMNDGIMDKLEFMALSGCQYLFVDHITILVSEGADGKDGNEAIDKVMNDLLRLTKRHNVWIGLVSHLRKTNNTGKPFEEGKLPSLDDIRGSGSIKQISFDIIAFARNLIADSETERNTIKMRVLKSRYTGLTGNVIGSVYDHKTGRLQGLTQESFSELDDDL